eukprot:CAMPEP_0178946628 /NCGR_PEP_ID=MMETSP0789-20121207/4393_1 /TAXON_ID=3005 /ORGANISM="Rhizosolenia setigera, Strain CCMP 1694" /LENGTH=259 /DNA_ID=CAMNT_0020626645 /DNA_START=169 /DNA_END=948 /DNA_ORIENTATION=+
MTISSAFSSPLSSTASSSSTSLSDLKSKKGILFDVDGTLADSWKLGFDATQVILKNNGVEKSITEEEYHYGCRYTTPERLARHIGLNPDDKDTDMEEYEKISTKLATEFDDMYVELVSLKTAGFYDGINPLLEKLAPNKKIGVLTNACVAYAHAVLKVNLNNEDAEDKVNVSVVEGADSVPKAKPHPDGLLQMCQELGLSPSECVYIGDSPSDGKAADAAGMSSIGVTWGSNSKEQLMEAPFLHICNTVEELTSLLVAE